MQGQPKVTACVVTYNQASYIEQCVVSILQQVGDFELDVLVGEDCSTDDTRAILATLHMQYPDRLTVCFNEWNMGAEKNTLSLVRKASGDYIALVDGDDYWLPGKLQAQLAFMQDHPDCPAVYTAAKVIDGDGNRVRTFSRAVPGRISGAYLLARCNFLQYSSVVLRADLRSEIQQVPSYGGLDYNIHLRLATHGRLGYLDRELTAYRVGHASSMMQMLPDVVRERIWLTITDPRFAHFGILPKLSGGTVFVADVLSAAWRRKDSGLAKGYLGRVWREQHLLGLAMILCGFAYFPVRGLLRSPWRRRRPS